MAGPPGGEELARALDAQPIVHPLLSDEALQLAADWEGTTEELYQILDSFDMVQENDGVESIVSSVRLVDYEPLPLEAMTPRAHEPVVFVLTNDIQAWMDATTTGPTDQLEVAALFDRTLWDRTVSVQHQQALAMLRGEATSMGDLHRIRMNVVDERVAAGEAYLADLQSLVEASGAEVLKWDGLTGTAQLLATPATLSVLLADPAVRRVQASTRLQDAAVAGYSTTVTGLELNGLEIQDMIQSVPLYLAGYRGLVEYIGLTEVGADLHNLHVSFENGSGVTRADNCQGTSATTCTWANLAVGDEHATRASSIINSDLTLGQDAGFTGPNEQRRRSGIARDSYVLGMEAGNGSRLVSLLPYYGVHMLNLSGGNGSSDPNCGGATAASNVWNDIYELGIAAFVAAGNVGTSSTTDCMVHDPATAIGSFTVNSTWVGPNPGAHDEEFYDAGSARGGTAIEGFGRSIVDIVAPSGYQLRAVEDSSLPQQYDSAGFFGSSGATPTVVGAAELFRDWYHDVHGSAIDDPGRLYANLLLMGDRALLPSLNGRSPKSYSNVTGAGRIRLRTFDPAGLDGPAEWASGAFCLPHGAAAHVPINNGNPLPASADYIKATAYWYDRQHGITEGNGHDEVEMHLQENVGGSWVYANSDTSGDNKLRVFYPFDPGGRTFRLRIEGVDIDSNDEGCGLKSNRIYYTKLYEDNARNDDATLSTYVRPE